MIPALWRALARAVEQLPEPGLRGPLVATLAWTALAFVAMWLGALHEFGPVAARFGPYGIVGWVGVVLLLGLATWLAFAVVANLILACYTERIIAAVETAHYPALAPAGPARRRDLMRSALRLLLLTVAGNLVLLPLYLILPGINVVLFLGLNGYVLGRGYFDAVTLRRMDDRTARLIWRARRGIFIVNGAVSAFLLTVPILNIIAPIVGLAATVHLLEWRPGAAS